MLDNKGWLCCIAAQHRTALGATEYTRLQYATEGHNVPRNDADASIPLQDAWHCNATHRVWMNLKSLPWPQWLIPCSMFYSTVFTTNLRWLSKCYFYTLDVLPGLTFNQMSVWSTSSTLWWRDTALRTMWKGSHVQITVQLSVNGKTVFISSILASDNWCTNWCNMHFFLQKSVGNQERMISSLMASVLGVPFGASTLLVGGEEGVSRWKIFLQKKLKECQKFLENPIKLLTLTR